MINATRIDTDGLPKKCELCQRDGQERIRNGRKICLECYVSLEDNEEGVYDENRR